MAEKQLDVSVLVDYYGSLLTEKQVYALNMFYNLDYSLAEMAENLGTTRQAAQDAVKRGREKLNYYEQKLGLIRKKHEMELVLLKAELSGELNGELAQTIRQIWEDD